MDSEDVWQIRDGRTTGGLSTGVCGALLLILWKWPLLGAPRLDRADASGSLMLRLGTSSCEAEPLRDEFGNSEAALPRALLSGGYNCRRTEVFARKRALSNLGESSRYKISFIDCSDAGK